MISVRGCVFLSAFSCLPASRAESDELELMGEDFIAAARFDRGLEFRQWLQVGISNLPASNATNMIVILDHTVKALLGSAQFEFASQAALTQHFQISVNRPKTDVRKSAPDELIELAGRRMNAIPLQLLQDDFSLTRHPQCALLGDSSSCCCHNMIIVIIRK
jgi:hypothetical protein